MNPQESEHLWRLVRTLQRQPEAVDDAEAQRALTVLLASRRDAPMLLLQRALVLETALAQLRDAHAAAAPVTDAAPVPGPTARRTAARPSAFLRDAGAVAAGMIGGGLALGALDTLGDAWSADDALP
jgi:hypothetical protein